MPARIKIQFLATIQVLMLLLYKQVNNHKTSMQNPILILAVNLPEESSWFHRRYDQWRDC